MPAPLVQAMQDKTAAVRSLAEQLLSLLNVKALIGKNALDKATRVSMLTLYSLMYGNFDLKNFETFNLFRYLPYPFISLLWSLGLSSSC